MKNEGGIILPAVLILSFLMAWTMLSVLRGLLIYVRTEAVLQSQHRQFRELENFSYHLLSGPFEKECQVAVREANAAVDFLRRGGGCAINRKGKLFQVSMEYLGKFPCLASFSEGVLYSTEHWRLTAMMAESHSVLQLRLAKPVKYLHCDRQDLHLINTGIISWRHLK